VLLIRRQPQWSRGLRRGSAAAHLGIRIPPGACMSIVCCQVEVSATRWSLVQRGPTEGGLYYCDRVAWVMRRPWLARCCCITEK